MVYIYMIYIYDMSIYLSPFVRQPLSPSHLLQKFTPFEIGSDEPWLQMDQGTQGLAERKAYL